MVANCRRSLFFYFCLALFIPAVASASTADFRVLFDTDNNQATGCTVNGMAGVDQVFLTRVETLASAGTVPVSARVTLTQRQVCTAGSLGAPIDVNTTVYPASLNAASGQVTVETRVPFTAFNAGGTMPRGMRLGFNGTNGAAVHNAVNAANGAAFIYPPLSNGKRRSVVEEDRTFQLDGATNDWGRIDALVQGIAGSGTPALRILRIFTYANPLDKFLYFRFEAFVDTSSPFANDDNYNRTQGSGLTVPAPGVLQNDTDPSGQPLTATPVSAPQHGDVTLNPDGSFTYSPQNPASTTTDTFEYKATNGAQESNVAKVTISVSSSLNRSPVAQSDSFGGSEDTAINSGTPGVLGNDNDPDGDALTVTLGTSPAHGTVTLNADGSFTYMPASNYFGSDSFTYTLSDGSLHATASVTITIAAVNDSPVVSSATFQVPENSTVGTVVGDVLATDVDSSNLTFAINDASGAFQIDPVTGRITVRNTAPLNFESTSSIAFDVTVTDDGSPQRDDTGSIHVTLQDANDAPVVQSQSMSTDEDTALAVTLPGTDQDGDALEYIIILQPLHGTITGTAPNLTYTPDENYSGQDTVIYLANDGDSDSGTGTITIQVNPINDPPLAGVDVFATTPGSGFTISPAAGVLANDIDAEGDALVAVIVAPPANGTINFADDGSFSYMPNAGFSGIDSFTYDVVEATSSSAAGVSAARLTAKAHAPTTVSINVSTTNTAPTANNQTVNTNEDTSKSITLTGSDPDGHAIRFDIATPPAHGRLAGSGSVLRYFPDDNYSGSDTFTFTVTDGFSVSPAGTVTINIAPINDAPVGAEDVYGVAAGNSLNVAAGIGVLANDTDIEGTSLTATLTQNVISGTLNLQPNGAFTYTPHAGFVGTDHFRYRAGDGTLQSQVTKVTINVRAGNIAPVATGMTVTTIEDSAVGITVTGTDADGDSLQFSSGSNPTHGTLSGVAPNFIYTPDPNYNGSDSFTFVATDGLATSAPATVNIIITSVNDTPVANDDAYATSEETTLIGSSVLANDTDADGPAPGTAALDLNV
jgi:VCBS repeat-containing protein